MTLKIKLNGTSKIIYIFFKFAVSESIGSMNVYNVLMHDATTVYNQYYQMVIARNPIFRSAFFRLLIKFETIMKYDVSKLKLHIKTYLKSYKIVR